MCECVSVVLVGVCDVCACACVMCGGCGMSTCVCSGSV